MRTIKKPDLETDEVFTACAQSIQKIVDRERVLGVKDYIRGAHKVYSIHGSYELLYQLEDEHGSGSACDEQVTKRDLVNLYENQLVKSKAGRNYYDKLLNYAHLGKCPFCTFGQALTLDHYMPKNKFPSFAIIPLNLVPSCFDCNRIKSENVAGIKGEQVIHPYFDNHLVNREQWLFAEVIEGREASIKFFVKAPSHWDTDSKNRVESHFRSFNLASRFAVEAASALSELYVNFVSLDTGNIKKELLNQAVIQNKLHINSWKTAMYQALSKSQWYCFGGFKIQY